MAKPETRVECLHQNSSETCNTLHRSTRNLLIQIFPKHESRKEETMRGFWKVLTSLVVGGLLLCSGRRHLHRSRSPCQRHHRHVPWHNSQQSSACSWLSQFVSSTRFSLTHIRMRHSGLTAEESSLRSSGLLFIGQCLDNVLLHCFPCGEDGSQQSAYDRNP